MTFTKCKRKIFYVVFVYVLFLFVFFDVTVSIFYLMQFKSINLCDFAVKIGTVINTYS